MQIEKRQGTLGKESDFYWVLEQKVGHGSKSKVQKKLMIVNPSSGSDIAKIQEFLPCIVQRRLKTPLTLNNLSVRTNLTLQRYSV